ncbi:hypothetical protein GQ600_22778 [Phytophthora cactorum]|nr:hypothetical protein GQ600_22778 [Phytophthora cactorum]
MPTPVRLRVKIGEITKASRNDVHVAEHVFSFDKERDIYEVFCRKVEERLWRTAQLSKEDYQTRDEPKPDSTSTRLGCPDSRNLAPRIALAYTNYQKCTKDSGPFKIEVFVLAARKERRVLPGTRRATASRVQEAATTIDNYLEQRHDLQVGEIAPRIGPSLTLANLRVLLSLSQTLQHFRRRCISTPCKLMRELKWRATSATYMCVFMNLVSFNSR